MAAPYVVTVGTGAKGGYTFRGDVRAMISTRDAQAILSGPADTGKTIACCVKLHLTALLYPKSQHAIIRKTFSSMASSVLQTFHRIIQGCGVRVLGADSPRLYTYPNGSQVWVGGMDKPEKSLSSERDTIYVNQAEELHVQDWELLSSRCTGRAAIVAHPQLYGDCNPAGALHWIPAKAKEGVLKLLRARHQDNPTLYSEAGELLPEAQRRMDVLSNLTGVRRKRLFEGIWATAEGAVYDLFDPSIHVLTRARNEFQRFHLAMDEGYTNPAVILEVGEDSDGRWHVFREYYERGQLQSAVAAQALAWYRQSRCRLAAVDEAAAGLIADLQDLGMKAQPGKGRVLDGIASIQNRLAVQPDGRPRLTFDPSCINCRAEFESYTWKPGADVPVKDNDHTSDALRYLADVLGEPSPTIGDPDRIRLGGSRLIGTTFRPARLRL